ncbi:MAG TPA: hypothetical protein VLX56_03105 [Nitrososphaerales archaeon]|nr:hypothetical protein [Nitrososphaerales archaeon]
MEAIEANYMSKERGRMTPVAEEAYSLRDVISKVTGLEYDIREASQDFPPTADRASWYLHGREFRLPKGTPYASSLWEDQEGNLMIRSMYIGDSTEWIGPIYGERGIIAAMKIDYANPELGRKTFAKKFPAVERRIHDYEAILAKVSSVRHVSLSLQPTGENADATFFIGARIEWRDLTAEKKEEEMRLNVDALKEAWNKITAYNPKLLQG